MLRASQPCHASEVTTGVSALCHACFLLAFSGINIGQELEVRRELTDKVHPDFRVLVHFVPYPGVLAGKISGAPSPSENLTVLETILVLFCV